MEKRSVIIVGAGLSGLFCANRLRKSGVDVVVVEAAPIVGGRIKPQRGFVDWKTLDLGAEFLHGDETDLKDVVDEQGWPARMMFTWAQGDGEHPKSMIGSKDFSMYYLGKNKRLIRYDTDDADVKRLNDVLWELGEIKVDPNDKRTLEQYLRQEKGFSDHMINLANAGYANSLCGTCDKMSLYEVNQIERAWGEYEEGDFRIEDSFYRVIEHLAQEMDVRTNWIVKRIEYTNSGVTVTSQSGKVIHGDRVVVTVPLNILKEGFIEFVPPLPKEKQEAIKALKMDNAMKVVLKVSKQFWPNGLNGIICTETPFPEIWFETPDRVGALTKQSKKVERKAPATPTYLVSGFATSTFADALSNKSKEELTQILINQLNEIFGNRKGFELTPESFRDVKSEADIVADKPASAYFLDSLVQDWSKEPFIKGGYTRPAPESSYNVRKALLAPIMDKVYFSGEAAHPSSYMTTNGSVETAIFVADTIIKQSKGRVNARAPRAKL